MKFSISIDKAATPQNMFYFSVFPRLLNFTQPEKARKHIHSSNASLAWEWNFEDETRQCEKEAV